MTKLIRFTCSFLLPFQGRSDFHAGMFLSMEHGVPGELWDASSHCCKSLFLPPNTPELMDFKELLESISPSHQC